MQTGQEPKTPKQVQESLLAFRTSSAVSPRPPRAATNSRSWPPAAPVAFQTSFFGIGSVWLSSNGMSAPWGQGFLSPVVTVPPYQVPPSGPALCDWLQPHYKAPQRRGRCGQGWASLLGVHTAISFLCPHMVLPVCVRVLMSSSYKDTSHTGLGHTHDLILPWLPC